MSWDWIWISQSPTISIGFPSLSRRFLCNFQSSYFKPAGICQDKILRTHRPIRHFITRIHRSEGRALGNETDYPNVDTIPEKWRQNVECEDTIEFQQGMYLLSNLKYSNFSLLWPPLFNTLQTVTTYREEACCPKFLGVPFRAEFPPGWGSGNDNKNAAVHEITEVGGWQPN